MPTTGRPTLSLVHRLRHPAVIPPAGGRPPLLILLHGVGANELAMAGLADRFDRRFLVVSPRAPLQVGPFAFAWLRVTFTPDGPVIDADEARDAWATAGRFVDEAVGAYGADPERVFLAGFSQGGIVALGTILTEPERVTGAVCMSGRLPPEVLPLLAPDERLRGRPILIVHGREDETLGIGFARSARAILEGLPVVLTYRELELGHTTSEESLGLVADWLAARLDS